MENLRNRKNWKYLIIGFTLLLIIVGIFATTLGAANIAFKESAGIIMSRLPLFNHWFQAEDYSRIHINIIWSLRFPRIVLAILVGGALSVVGATLQGFFRNPMADPYVMGVSSGAALGATVAIVTGASGIIGTFKIPAFSFLGAFLTTWIVYSLARAGKKVVVSTLLLAGVAMSSFLLSVISFLMVLNAEDIDKIYMWLMGNFANKDWENILLAAPFIFIGVIILFALAKEMNAMVFGDSTAQHLGINLGKMQLILLIATSLATAGAVAVCGAIGFVGLIIPHVVRIFVGPDHRILLPLSFLTGGIFMIVTDTIARTLMGSQEIPVGVITALFGGPFFLYLLKKKKEGI
ncbi:iron chelate uptake ABC transporter family permease subunit [Dehalobacter sp. DCM]|uniref:FecCD family ABC transporter permease n=1 Tax=Dehalobacter sp. DCM TaxID=2907827 RepID=UPI0030812ECB|nr:iron chelate uptake ABC transporter family permease subunit [Dehalobacter sp. DCM]